MPRPKECIFCGGKPLTREHLFGKWLTPVVVESRSSPPPIGMNFYIEIDRMKDGVLVPQGRRDPNKLNITVACVCEPCNGGWMGDMENAVRPIIKSLLEDGVRTISESEQLELARWAAKTVVIARYAAGLEVEPRYREWLYKQHSVPPKTLVWMGTYSGEGAASLESKTIEFEPDGERVNFPNAQFVVFTAGRLVIAILIAHIEGNFDFRPPELIDRYLRIISPYIGDIAWPISPLNETSRQAILQSSWDGTMRMKP